MRSCRVCGCTENNACHTPDGPNPTCHWVEPDLCSACVSKVPEGELMMLNGEEKQIIACFRKLSVGQRPQTIRFMDAMLKLLESKEPNRMITQKQSDWIYRLRYTFRNQIPKDVPGLKRGEKLAAKTKGEKRA